MFRLLQGGHLQGQSLFTAACTQLGFDPSLGYSLDHFPHFLLVCLTLSDRDTPTALPQ